MIDTSLALQRAIVTRLKADDDVKALVDLKIYDDVPPAAQMPYVSFGSSQKISQDAECIIGDECFQQVDVWTREPGSATNKAIAGIIKAALHQVTTTQDGLTFEINHVTTIHSRDPDGVTSHGVLSFRAEIDT